MDLTTLSQPPWLYVLIFVAVLLVAAVAWGIVRSARRRREREELQRHYGAEYDRTLALHRSTRDAVDDLRRRREQHDELELRDLNEADRDVVRRHMATLQYRFVEDPSGVVLQTQRVVVETLRARGYPVDEDRDQGLRLFSVDHPDHAVAVRSLLEDGHDRDGDDLRATFLAARRTLQDVAGISYVLGDAADAASDLRVDHATPVPAGESR